MKKWTFEQANLAGLRFSDEMKLEDFYFATTSIKANNEQYTLYSYSICLLTNDEGQVIDDRDHMEDLNGGHLYDTYWQGDQRHSLFEFLCETPQDVAMIFKKLSARTFIRFSNETYAYFRAHPHLLQALSLNEIADLYLFPTKIGSEQDATELFLLLMNALTQIPPHELGAQVKKLANPIQALISLASQSSLIDLNIDKQSRILLSTDTLVGYLNVNPEVHKNLPALAKILFYFLDDSRINQLIKPDDIKHMLALCNDLSHHNGLFLDHLKPKVGVWLFKSNTSNLIKALANNPIAPTLLLDLNLLRRTVIDAPEPWNLCFFANCQLEKPVAFSQEIWEVIDKTSLQNHIKAHYPQLSEEKKPRVLIRLLGYSKQKHIDLQLVDKLEQYTEEQLASWLERISEFKTTSDLDQQQLVNEFLDYMASKEAFVDLLFKRYVAVNTNTIHLELPFFNLRPLPPDFINAFFSSNAYRFSDRFIQIKCALFLFRHWHNNPAVTHKPFEPLQDKVIEKILDFINSNPYFIDFCLPGMKSLVSIHFKLFNGYFLDGMRSKKPHEHHQLLFKLGFTPNSAYLCKLIDNHPLSAEEQVAVQEALVYWQSKKCIRLEVLIEIISTMAMAPEKSKLRKMEKQMAELSNNNQSIVATVMDLITQNNHLQERLNELLVEINSLKTHSDPEEDTPGANRLVFFRAPN